MEKSSTTSEKNESNQINEYCMFDYGHVRVQYIANNSELIDSFSKADVV